MYCCTYLQEYLLVEHRRWPYKSAGEGLYHPQLQPHLGLVDCTLGASLHHQLNLQVPVFGHDENQ